MEKYRLIKRYPGSPELGFEIDLSKINCETIGGYYPAIGYLLPPKKWTVKVEDIKNNPEFWQKVEELCVPVGTKFKAEGLSEKVYTIKEINKDKVTVSWPIGKFEGSTEYYIDTVNDLFNEKDWIVYEEEPILFTTEDGVDIKEGDKFYPVCVELGFGYIPFVIINQKWTKLPLKGFKAFSTKEAAQDFIIMNKPCLSINDFKKLHLVINEIELKELVKSKL